MAKMLMGQIDHARDRIKELTKLKLDEKPVVPKIRDGSDVLADIKKGNIDVTPAVLKKAWQRFINKTPITIAYRESGCYNYETRRHEKGPSQLKESYPDDIETAIRDVIFEKEIAARVSEFTKLDRAYQEKKNKILTKASEVEDYIVLGDVHTALQALKDFEAMEF